jgi:Sec-independent protein secretion pathway component TatC
MSAVNRLLGNNSVPGDCRAIELHAASITSPPALPPTDIMNMCIFAAQMIVLYLFDIGIAWFVHPAQRRKRAEKAGRTGDA